MTPMEWLRDVWMSMVKLVVNSVAAKAKEADQNNIGEISFAEARKWLIESEADIDKATVVCVEERKKKVNIE